MDFKNNYPFENFNPLFSAGLLMTATCKEIEVKLNMIKNKDAVCLDCLDRLKRII